MLCTEPLFRRYFSILGNTKAGTLLIMIAGAAALNRSVYILLRNDVRFSSLGSHRLGIGDGRNRLLRAVQYHRRETCQVSQFGLSVNLDDAPVEFTVALTRRKSSSIIDESACRTHAEFAGGN